MRFINLRNLQNALHNFEIMHALSVNSDVNSDINLTPTLSLTPTQTRILTLAKSCSIFFEIAHTHKLHTTNNTCNKLTVKIKKSSMNMAPNGRIPAISVLSPQTTKRTSVYIQNMKFCRAKTVNFFFFFLSRALHAVVDHSSNSFIICRM